MRNYRSISISSNQAQSSTILSLSSYSLFKFYYFLTTNQSNPFYFYCIHIICSYFVSCVLESFLLQNRSSRDRPRRSYLSLSIVTCALAVDIFKICLTSFWRRCRGPKQRKAEKAQEFSLFLFFFLFFFFVCFSNIFG